MTCRKKIVCLVMAIIAVFTCLCGCGKQGASADENKEPEWVFSEPEYGISNNIVIGNFAQNERDYRVFVVIHGWVWLKQIDEHNFIVVRITKDQEKVEYIKIRVGDGSFVMFMPNVNPLYYENPDRVSIYTTSGFYE